MSSERDLPSPEQCETIRANLPGEESENRPEQVLRKLLDKPRGLIAKELAIALGLEEATIRQHILQLRERVAGLPFGDATSLGSNPFYIWIPARPYRVRLSTKEESERRRQSHRKAQHHASSELPAGESPFLASDAEYVRTCDSNLLAELLAETIPDANEEHDFRIATSAFSLRIKDNTELKLFIKPLERGVKISVILLNPRNLPLCAARFGLRTDLSRERDTDDPTDRAVHDLHQQIHWLFETAAKFPTLKVKLADNLPLGFVALNARRASLGLFMAKTPAADAPHILAEKGSPLWEALRDDWDYRWQHSIAIARFNAFSDFWGTGPTNEAQIIVQADRIETLAAHSGVRNEELALDKIRDRPPTRVWKARVWVNRWDLDAAVHIRDQFQREGIPAPRLVQIGRSHGEPIVTNAHATFVISLGLGFTDETTATREYRCDEWMRMPCTAKWGDALALHVNLITSPVGRKYAAKLGLEPKEYEKKPGFKCLVPQGWTLRRWLSDQTCHDYAIILRYVISPDGVHRRPAFVAAGFSDRATSVAGQYLAANWLELRERAGNGDFLAIITGPSNPSEIDKWSRVDQCWLITPREVAAAGLEWRKR